MDKESKHMPTQEEVDEWQKNKQKYFEDLWKLYEKHPELKKQFEETTEGIQHPYH